MTDDSHGDAPGVTLQDLASRLDDLTREVRRQGRAAVAAQAAAESCLEKLSAAGADDDAGEGDGPENGDRPAAAGADEWIRALLPVADALDRMVAQAAAMAGRPSPPEPRPRSGFLSLFSHAPRELAEPARDGEIRALAEGLRVLRAQLATALEGCGVTADRRTGVPVDPDVHRVVEARATRPGEKDGIVVEVIRPGYSMCGQTVREAEVVAAKGGDERPPRARTP